jgi:putative nucleotidyltransferase with HDIG domain
VTLPPLAERRRGAVIDVAHALVHAALNRRMHARDSRHVLDALADLVTCLRAAKVLGVEMPLALQCSDDRLFHDGQPLDGPSLQARALLRRLAERGIAMLSLQPALGVDEANRMLDLLLLPANREALARSNRDSVLLAFGVRNVRVSLRTPADPSDRRSQLDDRQALHSYQELADALQHNQVQAHRDQELAVDAAATAIERTVAAFDEPSTLLSLANQDDVDRFTVGHSVRVALLALQVARELGCNREQLVHVGSAALLHDIGKAKVPHEVLFKQGALTPDEWAAMAEHPRLGAELLLEQHEHVDARTIGAAYCHHMRPDGAGYPRPGLPICPGGTSRLVRVCDVFEALTSVRPYKTALAPVEAYAVMFRNEADFDPQWLRRFVRTIGLFPTGSRLRLASGAQAIVLGQTDRPERPRLRLFTGKNDAPLMSGEPDECVVGEPFDGELVRVASLTQDERCIALPELDPDAPAALSKHSAHACLSPHPSP